MLNLLVEYKPLLLNLLVEYKPILLDLLVEFKPLLLNLLVEFKPLLFVCWITCTVHSHRDNRGVHLVVKISSAPYYPHLTLLTPTPSLTPHTSHTLSLSLSTDKTRWMESMERQDGQKDEEKIYEMWGERLH